ncbi:MAG TPA: class I SAM-dependent methyltransferase [Deltaproteobacteria bacterium]|nr:class I SAM-dependent methyltransferase [Deltaproteobacteria bacterium]HPR54085.1 class I SAM-dependent methyltransferase [Deltaproteobacteria bacterium]HXK46865.1 class I SAM-dependent methyltransferase [Deltaproteobacteria bacterium]
MRLKRDLRYSVETNDTGKAVRFHDFQKNEHSCRVKDYSRTGVSFYLEDGSLLLHIGDIINDLKFYSFDQEVHAAGATIIHIEDEEKDGQVVSCIGCSYNDQPMDVYSVMRADKISKLQNDFLDFVQSMAIEENLDPEFVNLTSHLHFILEGFSERLTRDLNGIRDEDEGIQEALLETLRELAFDALFDELNRYYDHFTTIISRFTDSKQHFIHREFFQKRLNEYLTKSALFHRSITKPLGYAGDYEMMNIIYRNTFEGDSLFAQVLNKVDCEGTASRAVRNRRSYLYKKLRDLLAGNTTGGDLKIMSVACGPAHEFTDLIRGYDGKTLPFAIEFIAMDQDSLALGDARSRIEPIIRENPSLKVHFEQDNIKRLIVEKENGKNLYAGADMVYTAGLFDYLSDRASNRLIHKLYSFLKPGGLLTVGNFGIYNPQRFIMEYGAEWFLIHRSEEELKRLATDLPDNPDMIVEKEPEGVNLFLNIRKPLRQSS